MNPLPQGPPQAVAMSRPQVGIERLPTRRMSNEPRESMNCKSCRKRKIKCNRLRPACEACQVFQCPCIYDAVPKKRGPKTDVLEALLKRVDGLEAKLKEKTATEKSTEQAAPTTHSGEPSSASGGAAAATDQPGDGEEPRVKRLAIALSRTSERDGSAMYSPTLTSEPSPPAVQQDALLDTYFSRFHAKPFHILDESSARQRLQLNQLPGYLLGAICAVAARHTPHPSGHQAAVKLSEDYAARSRAEIDTDEPSIDALQALLLLVLAFTASGRGKKAYMLMSNAVGMSIALETHREVDSHTRVTPVEREMRRMLFWTCYLLDRFMACGSKRPSLLGDRSILLRLPCWSPNRSALPIEGEFFQAASNLQYLEGSGKKSQGSTSMLIDIARILGITNRYLAAGGVKGDSHFPWHSLSNLSKIRHDLDIWASGTEDVFSSLDALFGHPDSTTLVLSKLVYHLIHCLVYRPFLPVDLSELSGTGQHHSWQIEATNMCFLHANAIAELVELGKQAGTIEWPAFVGYCICTAGTVHIHGVHYKIEGDGGFGVFSSAADFLSREMQQLSELRYAWASVQHQRETLQAIYNAHTELIRDMTMNSARYSPSFHLEDFFDRYVNAGLIGQDFNFDAANLGLADAVVDFTADSYVGHDLYAPRNSNEGTRPSLKRKSMSSSGQIRQDPNIPTSLAAAAMPTPSPGLPTPSHLQQSFPPHQGAGMVLHQNSGRPGHPNSLQQAHNHATLPNFGDHYNSAPTNSVGVGTATALGFAIPLHHQQQGHQHQHQQRQQQLQQSTMSSISNGPGPFSPQFSFNTQGGAGTSDGTGNFDSIFGAVPTNTFGSPTAWHGGGTGSGNGNGNGNASDKVPAASGTVTGAKGAHGAATSPGAKSTGGSTGGSTGTGSAEEKDPFLSLLEQLAENQQQLPRGNGLDFFFSGNAGSGQ
ncbi:hypothetical protein SODALDRAFT_119469 [Sodiomyces alkalinus F11]|uniref:Zn(2)-C6 fungal-type domain-containing protein n=1 Tax=Sodiomyces alkalinus (strain CBS 110278 / VKM F-3762 / F11) TaxID=1314773 RepID=A0A3N2Q3V9_SODAK|nr:hypothetical protein SODALDRAFT_119469 [Sodiomyces alkalinus F11]ROT41439.1 hypothetical protein SODALDRAFT_119469 [Sodiomyces alkalinus F11]